jgi:hypothetical protein
MASAYSFTLLPNRPFTDAVFDYVWPGISTSSVEESLMDLLRPETFLLT